MPIITSTEYDIVLKRLAVGEKLIVENGGFFKAPSKWIDEFQKLAEEALLYEIENNLLPI